VIGLKLERTNRDRPGLNYLMAIVIAFTSVLSRLCREVSASDGPPNNGPFNNRQVQRYFPA
jgi:hypothetical protein